MRKVSAQMTGRRSVALSPTQAAWVTVRGIQPDGCQQAFQCAGGVLMSGNSDRPPGSTSRPGVGRNRPSPAGVWLVPEAPSGSTVVEDLGAVVPVVAGVCQAPTCQPAAPCPW